MLLISNEEIKQWEKYSSKLEKYPIVKKYLEKHLKKWVESPKVLNPLAIPWIYELFNDNLNWLEDRLQMFESDLNQENIERVLREFKKGFEKGREISDMPVDEISKKLSSLEKEIIVYSFLRWKYCKEYTKIQKIFKIGDWKCSNNSGNELIVSVKAKLELDFNFQIIENYLKGMFHIKENDILRAINYINISKGKNLTDSFRKQVISYLEKEFIGDFVSILGDGLFVEGSKIFKHLKINIDFDRFDRRKVTFHFSTKSGSEIKITFKNDPNKNKDIVDFDCDTNTFFKGEEMDLKALKNWIGGHLGGFDKSYAKEKDFVGIFVYPVHHKHIDYLNQNSDVVKIELEDFIGNKEYPIIVIFYPQHKFDHYKSHIFESAKGNATIYLMDL